MTTHTQAPAAGAVVGRFRALETFFAEETKSEYAAGQVYNLREGNDVLAVMVSRWADENKVEVI